MDLWDTEVATLIKDAYLKKEYRPVAVALIRNQAGKILFVRSAKNQDEWYLPQGGIEEGEYAKSALFREIKEELGIELDALHIVAYLGVDELNAESTREDKRGFRSGKRYFLFGLLYNDECGILKVNQEEISECRWITQEDVPLILSTTRKEKGLLIMKWLNKLKDRG